LSLDEELSERVRQPTGAEKSMFTDFNSNDFSIADLLPQGKWFTAQYFFFQILKPMSQEYSTKSADIARRSLRFNFDNSRCHAVKIVSEEITCLKIKGVPNPHYSPDLAIADFHLFGVLQQNLQGIDGSDHEALKSEMLPISQGIRFDEVKKSFDQWIERCQWIIANAKNYYRSSPEHANFILFLYFSQMPI
jgi:hypothetical protein